MAKQRQPIQESKTESISVDLGFADLIDLGDSVGYIPTRPEVNLNPQARIAVKRLALTLETRGATLADGSPVRNSVSRTIAWLCERLTESITNVS